jgi:hypothetical protein
MSRFATKEAARAANARGRQRRIIMQAEDAAETARVADMLLMSLRRPPTIEDQLKADLIGRTACRIGRLEEQRRSSLAERKLLEDLLRKPFNAPESCIGPRVEGATTQRYFTVTKGDGFVCRTDPAPDEAAAADEALHVGK